MLRAGMTRAVVFLLLAALLLTAPASSADPPKDLPGTSVDYAYDGKDIRRPALAWFARAYVPPEAAAAARPVPLIVFLHGTNKKLIKYRWMGGGHDPDLRAFIGEMVAKGTIEPVVIAAPSSVVKSQVLTSSWDYFDVDKFVAHTKQALAGTVAIDDTRVIVAGHSGAGCSTEGGLAALATRKRPLLGLMSIDTCMRIWLAHRLARASKHTHVVVSYQTVSWTDRPFEDFRATFVSDATKRGVGDGVLRTVEELHATQGAHQASVALSFERWLPQILAKPRASAAGGASAVAP